MRLFVKSAMELYRRCLAVYDEIYCMSYVNSIYGVWFVELSDDVAMSILAEAVRRCAPVEYAVMYCILCQGAQCTIEPTEPIVRHVEACLAKLSIPEDVKVRILEVLRGASEAGSGVSCI